MPKKISYQSAGVDISTADATKKDMAKTIATDNPLVLNSIGAFASLCDGSFPGYKHPVLVCKTEEPGSKQLLAFKYDRIESICHDLINHLVNDVIVMGATPLFIQDLIVCGKLEKDVVSNLVKYMAKACKAQGCALTGGETSEQPSVLPAGTYVLGASCIGVVDKSQIIDGSTIKPGDAVIALQSSGVHTNGYTLLRALIDREPGIIDEKIDGRTFLDAIMEPHRCYYQALKGLFGNPGLHGLAHITGGGIPGNLNRILPVGTDAVIDAASIKVLPLFSFIKDKSGNDDADMIRTFNLGVGAIAVTDQATKKDVIAHLEKNGVPCTEIGTIVMGGTQKVRMEGDLKWN